jgi:hypothetical protein
VHSFLRAVTRHPQDSSDEINKISTEEIPSAIAKSALADLRS